MPPAKLNSTSVSSAGITIDATTGEHYIPSSVRPDGSRRREIRIRPGYKPPEDVGIYKSRAAEAWKNRDKAGVPGAASAVESSAASGEVDSSTTVGNIPVSNDNIIFNTASSNKNAKRREARKKAKAAASADAGEGGVVNGDGVVDGETPPSKNERGDVRDLDTWRPVNGDDTRQDVDAENEKKARNLRKKLRQARELSDKKDQGASLLPDQLGKIIKINELVRQLEVMGLDTNAGKKESQKEECQQKEPEKADEK